MKQKLIDLIGSHGEELKNSSLEVHRICTEACNLTEQGTVEVPLIDFLAIGAIAMRSSHYLKVIHEFLEKKTDVSLNVVIHKAYTQDQFKEEPIIS